VPPSKSRNPQLAREPAPISSLTASVLARLPAAERERSALRRQQNRERTAGVVAAALLLCASLGFQGSDLATRALAWIYAAAVVWKGLVEAALGGLVVLPVLSACCLLGISIVLWQRVLAVGRRSLP